MPEGHETWTDTVPFHKNLTLFVQLAGNMRVRFQQFNFRTTMR